MRVWSLCRDPPPPREIRTIFRNARACHLTPDGQFVAATFYIGKRRTSGMFGPVMSTFRSCIVLMSASGQHVYQVKPPGIADAVRVARGANVMAVGLYGVEPAEGMARGDNIIIYNSRGEQQACFRDCFNDEEACVAWDLSEQGDKLALCANRRQAIEVYSSGFNAEWNSPPIVLRSHQNVTYETCRLVDSGDLVSAMAVDNRTHSRFVVVFHVRDATVLFTIPSETQARTFFDLEPRVFFKPPSSFHAAEQSVRTLSKKNPFSSGVLLMSCGVDSSEQLTNAPSRNDCSGSPKKIQDSELSLDRDLPRNDSVQPGPRAFPSRTSHPPCQDRNRAPLTSRAPLRRPPPERPDVDRDSQFQSPEPRQQLSRRNNTKHPPIFSRAAAASILDSRRALYNDTPLQDRPSRPSLGRGTAHISLRVGVRASTSPVDSGRTASASRTNDPHPQPTNVNRSSKPPVGSEAGLKDMPISKPASECERVDDDKAPSIAPTFLPKSKTGTKKCSSPNTNPNTPSQKPSTSVGKVIYSPTSNIAGVSKALDPSFSDGLPKNDVQTEVDTGISIKPMSLMIPNTSCLLTKPKDVTPNSISNVEKNNTEQLSHKVSDKGGWTVSQRNELSEVENEPAKRVEKERNVTESLNEKQETSHIKSSEAIDLPPLGCKGVKAVPKSEGEVKKSSLHGEVATIEHDTDEHMMQLKNCNVGCDDGAAGETRLAPVSRETNELPLEAKGGNITSKRVIEDGIQLQKEGELSSQIARHNNKEQDSSDAGLCCAKPAVAVACNPLGVEGDTYDEVKLSNDNRQSANTSNAPSRTGNSMHSGQKVDTDVAEGVISNGAVKLRTVPEKGIGKPVRVVELKGNRNVVRTDVDKVEYNSGSTGIPKISTSATHNNDITLPSPLRMAPPVLLNNDAFVQDSEMTEKKGGHMEHKRNLSTEGCNEVEESSYCVGHKNINGQCKVYTEKGQKEFQKERKSIHVSPGNREGIVSRPVPPNQVGEEHEENKGDVHNRMDIDPQEELLVDNIRITSMIGGEDNMFVEKGGDEIPGIESDGELKREECLESLDENGSPAMATRGHGEETPPFSSPSVNRSIKCETVLPTYQGGEQRNYLVPLQRARSAFRKACQNLNDSFKMVLTNHKAFMTMLEVIGVENVSIDKKLVAKVVYDKGGINNACAEDVFLEGFYDLYREVRATRRRQWEEVFATAISEEGESLLVFHARDLVKKESKRLRANLASEWRDDVIDELFETEAAGMLVDLDAFVRGTEKILYI